MTQQCVYQIQNDHLVFMAAWCWRSLCVFAFRDSLMQKSSSHTYIVHVFKQIHNVVVG